VFFPILPAPLLSPIHLPLLFTERIASNAQLNDALTKLRKWNILGNDAGKVSIICEITINMGANAIKNTVVQPKKY
jgi:hypothetical protein